MVTLGATLGTILRLATTQLTVIIPASWGKVTNSCTCQVTNGNRDQGSFIREGGIEMYKRPSLTGELRSDAWVRPANQLGS